MLSFTETSHLDFVFMIYTLVCGRIGVEEIGKFGSWRTAGVSLFSGLKAGLDFCIMDKEHNEDMFKHLTIQFALTTSTITY